MSFDVMRFIGFMKRALWITQYLLSGCLFISIALPVHATERRYYFQGFGNEPGLAQNTVTAILQDHTGYIWIGTQGGLHKFDSYRFHAYQHNADDPDSLPDSFVTAIAEDAEGGLWVGSSISGLSRFDPATGKFKRYSESDGVTSSSPHNTISALLFEAPHSLWIGSAAGIDVLNLASGERHEAFTFHAGSSQHAKVTRLSLGSDRVLWAATSQGLLSIDTERREAHLVTLPELEHPFSVLSARDSNVYIGTAAGLFRLSNDETLEHLWPDTAQQKAPQLAVWDITEDKRGRLWLAIHGQGLVMFNPVNGHNDWLRYDREMPGSLPEDFESTVFVDRSGLLWVGGETRGVVTANPDGARFRYITDRTMGHNPIAGNNIRTIWQDKQHYLWLGTEGDGLKRYNPADGNFDYFGDALGQALGLKNQPSELRIFSAQDAEAGKLWVSSNRGVFLLDPARHQATLVPVDPTRNDALPDASVHSLLKARDGSLWFGTYTAGLAHWWPKTNQWEFFRHYDNQTSSLSNNMVLALTEDHAGQIWIGTLDGLNLYEPANGQVRMFRHNAQDPHSLCGNLVRAIHESPSGTLWIGTHSGLSRLDSITPNDARFTRYLVRNGLPSATIYGILEDAHGRLWLSTNQGISRFDRQTEQFQNFSLKDGLQGLEFNGSAYYRSANGELWFGGINGLNAFYPDEIEVSSFVPPVVFTHIEIGSEPRRISNQRVSQGLSIAQAERIVRFEFAALDFAAPSHNQFAYRLEGFDDNWIQANTKHDATYTNLDPGDYVFHVRASNHDGVWGTAEAALPITITPQWWASHTAKACGAILSALSILYIWWTRQRKRAENLHHLLELQQRDDRLRLALWGSGDVFWDWDMGQGVLYRIGSDQMFGGKPEESLTAEDWRERAVHPEDLPLVNTRLEEHVHGHKNFFESEHRIRNAKGGWITVLARGKIVERDATGKPLRVCGTARDVTASREVERERRIAAEVIKNMAEAVSVTDLDFRFTSINDAFTRMTGYSTVEVIGKSAAILDGSRYPNDHYQVLREEMKSNGHWRGELWLQRKNGEEFLGWIELSEVLDTHGVRSHYVSVLTDITDRKRSEQELRYLANYDTLTGLANRTLLSERLGHAIIRARRSGTKAAVLFLDLDRFKHVNDSMGHAAGDRMLKAAGTRLRASVRETDTVARLGGDEFTVILEDLEDVFEAEKIALKLLEVFTLPLELENGQEVIISPSIGISLYPNHAQSPSDLLKCADTAMYQAKERGRNTYAVYTEAMDTTTRQRANMVSALQKALERGEFSLVFQPKLSLHDNRIRGVEALLRWNNAYFGQIPPNVFIPLAEETGAIVEIGKYVLIQACTQLAQWRSMGLSGLTMSINVSMLQLLRGNVAQQLRETLAKNAITPNQIELELTESVVMANAEQSVKTLTELKSLGIMLSIDDFGTGYSSLSHLKRLPIDTLKIDKEFVSDITTDPDDEAITATIITMAHSLGLTVIGEGVETAQQLEYLRDQGCDEIQGFWLTPALAPTPCMEFVRNHNNRLDE